MGHDSLTHCILLPLYFVHLFTVFELLSLAYQPLTYAVTVGPPVNKVKLPNDRPLPAKSPPAAITDSIEIAVTI